MLPKCKGTINGQLKIYQGKKVTGGNFTRIKMTLHLSDPLYFYHFPMKSPSASVPEN